jgi:hypothetical protein
MLANVTTFFETMAAVGRMEKGPQDVPSSYVLTVVAVLAYGLVKFCDALFQFKTQEGFRVGMAALYGSYDTILALAIILGSLAATHYMHRANQTITTFMTVGAAISLVSVGFMLILYVLPDDMDLLLNTGVTRAMRFPLTLLALAMNAHIMREALSTSFLAGVGIALAHLMGILFFIK